MSGVWDGLAAHTRAARAVEYVRTGAVTPVNQGMVFEVKGRSNTYTVTVSPTMAACNCAYGQHRKIHDWSDPCAHALAAGAVAGIEPKEST